MTSVAAEGGRPIERRAPRWMWITLFASLAVNLMILGVVFGTIWAVKKGGYWEAPTMIERNFRFMRYLAPERRDRVRAVFKRHKPGLAPYWADVREARLRISHMIAKGGYSPEDMERAMDQLFEKEVLARQAAKPMLTDMLAELSPKEKLHFLRVFVPYLDEAQSGAEVKISE